MEKVDFTNIWYVTKEKAEIIYAIKEEGIYSGIITNINKDFDCTALSFSKIESDDNYDLQINTNNERQLSSKTLNIIKEYNLQVIVL
jgi:restriction endonuclease